MSRRYVQCKHCNGRIYESSLINLSKSVNLNSKPIPMKMASSMTFSTTPHIHQFIFSNKKGKNQTTPSSVKTDSPLKSLFFDKEGVSLPYDLPMCSRCYQKNKIENILNVDVEQQIENERHNVEMLQNEIQQLKLQQNLLNNEKSIMDSLREKNVQLKLQHSLMIAQFYEMAHSSSTRFLQTNIIKDKVEVKTLEDNTWNQLFKMEWTASGVVINGTNIPHSYKNKKWIEVGNAFICIIKQIMLISYVLKMKFQRVSILTPMAPNSNTLSYISNSDFSKRKVRKIKYFAPTLHKLMIVVDELVRYVQNTFSNFKPIYTIFGDKVNGLSVIPINNPRWDDAIKYFLSTIKYVRDFVITNVTNDNSQS
ncbi:Atg6 BARA domain-containing protein [Entamoeba marina]